MADPRVVIVADPDPDERSRVRKSLDDISTFMDVLEASNRGELEEHLASRAVDLIITELLLEGGSGFDLLRSLAERKGEDAPPVIVVTEMARELDRYWALRNGAHAFVSKPYEVASLQDRIRKALAGGPRDTPDSP